MKKTSVRKALSVCMVVTLLFSNTAAISATGIDEVLADDSSLAAVTEKTFPKPGPIPVDGITTVAGEKEELRGEYEKHFLMPDGTFVAAVYDVPVHYLDEQTGEWNEIDNTLQAAVDVSGDAVYSNRDGLFDVSFAQTATATDPLVTLKSDGHSISWRFVQPSVASGGLEVMSASEEAALVTALPSAQVLTAEPVIVPADTVDMSASKTTGMVLYEDLVGQNADVRLTVTPVKVKEDILLTAVPAQAVSYTTRLTLSAGLVPTLGEDGTVFIRDTEGADVFRIAAPYMTDAMDELSQDVEVELLFVNGAWELTVTPDMVWLTDAARVYPVTIDPTVYASNNATNTWDTYIYQNCTSSDAVSRQDLDRMYVGNRTSANQLKCRGLVQFLTMPTVYGDITSAQLSFTTPSGTTSWKNMTLYRNTEAWNCSTAAWPGPAATAIQSKAASGGRYTFDVTSVIQAMYYNNSAGTVGNYGFQIRYQDETASDYNSLRSSEWWTDTEDESAKPYLAITYNAYSPCSFTSGQLFHITNVASGNYLSVTGFGAAGTVLSGEAANYRGNQSWKLVHEGNGVYSATPAFRTALRMNTPGIADGQNVNVVTGDGSDAQRWFILPNADGTYYFMPVSAKDDTKVLQVENATAGSVSSAEVSTWTGTDQQKWNITPISSPTYTGITSGKTYYVKNASTGKYLGMVNDTNATLVVVGQDTKVQNGRQRWRVTYSNGNYVLQPIIGHDGVFRLDKSLEIPNGTVGTGVYPKVNTHSGAQLQQFQIKPLTDTTAALLTGCSGYNTALAAGSGTAVSTAYYSGSATAQQWIFEPAFDESAANMCTAISLGGEFFVESTSVPEQYADVKLSKRAFSLMGHNAVYDTQFTIMELYDLVALTKVVHFSCHGGYDGVHFYNATDLYGGTEVYINMTSSDEPGWDIHNVFIGDFILDNCKLMIFDSCSAYLPGENNDICDVAVANGVQAAIGWDHPIAADNLYWYQDFYDFLIHGKTVTEAVDLMNDLHHREVNDSECSCNLGSDCTMYNVQLVGDGDFRLFE